jgi:hypothetical protein
MPRVPPYNCPVCHRPVLSLTGQDCYLPAYATHDAAPELVASGVVGFTHGSCLLTSGHAESWTRLLAENVNQVASLLFSDDLLAVLWQENTDELIVVDAGKELRLGRALVSKINTLPQSLVVEIEYVYNLRLEGRAQLRDEVEQGLRSSKTFPLSRVVDEFGVRDRLRDPSDLSDAELLPDADADETFSELRHMAFTGMVKSRVMIPEQASSAIEEFLEGARQ